MIKSKKQMFIIVSVYTIVMLLGTITYAFFNYTRTGSSNTIRVGRMYFDSTQNNTINLENVFPTDSNHLDNTNSSTVTINITGDTSYEDGIEYKVSLVDVNNTVNNKDVPISFSVTANNLGTKSSDYYNDRGSTTNVYNLRETGIAINGEDILTGYIKSDNVGVNGSINITAYIDKNEIGISDTTSRIDNNNLVYGETDGEWIAGRTILTTSEWNSLQSNGVSFKVKVEANEGIWVPEPKTLVLKNLNDVTEWQNIRSNITSIEFSNNSAVPSTAITSFDATDLTSEGPVTVYTLDDNLGNNTVKAVIAGDGVIYAPQINQELFAYMTNLVTFNSENFKVDNVSYMISMFALDSKLVNIIGLSTWNTSNVVSMLQMFFGCELLPNIDFVINWDTSNVLYASNLFGRCNSIHNLNGVVNWNTSNVTDMSGMFQKCTNLEDISPLSNWNVSSVTSMTRMFDGCTSLQYVSGINDWDIRNVTSFTNMFRNTLAHPEFTKVTGTWTAAGTFTPNS